MSVGCILVDFDGTACAVDVTGELCERFAAKGWEALDQGVLRGELTLREAIVTQTTMLRASRVEMLRFVLAEFALDPTFVRLARCVQAAGLTLSVVSEGFGFYIQPMLRAAGLAGVPVRANHVTETDTGLRLQHPWKHAECIGCGTCKMRAVLESRGNTGPVAFVGDGESDRHAAVYANAVFAKRRLAELCDQRGIPFLPWHDFGDVYRALNGAALRTNHSSCLRCQGWTTHAAGRSPRSAEVTAYDQ
jgi:2-hydroxy-3-keto-5-methylthiopentenyl-1-phosphate phosphatase